MKLNPTTATRLQKPDMGFYFLAGRQYPRIKWMKDPNLRNLYCFCFLLILVNVANGFDGSMMNGLQSLPYWQIYFGYPTGVKLSLFGSAMSLGALIGLPFVPYLCDHLGRKTAVIIGSFIIILGVGLQAGALNFDMFFAARMVLGVGMTLATASGPLLVAEISHPQDRALLTTFMGLAYAIGAFVASWVTFGTLKIQSDWAWRAPSLLQGWCTVVILAVVWWMPESPRYYIAKDQHEKALQILAHYHANGNENDEIVQLQSPSRSRTSSLKFGLWYTVVQRRKRLDREARRPSLILRRWACVAKRNIDAIIMIIKTFRKD